MMDLRKKIAQDTFVVNTLLLALLVMALSTQMLTVMVWIFSFIPIKPSPLVTTLFPRQLALVLPEREMFFYHFFIVIAILLQAAGMFILKPHLSKRTFIPQLAVFTRAEYGWTFLIVFSVFKMFVYGWAPWTKVFFYTSLILSVLSKVFWNEIRHSYAKAMHYWEEHRGDIKVHHYCDLFFAFLIFLIIYIPDTQGLLAKMFMTDHFHHFDTMIMAPAWAYLKGAVLGVDHFTQYSIGLAVVIGHLAQITGGFNYPSVIKLLCLGTVVYYIGVYALARFWLKSIPVAMAMVILLIKWQMFHPGVASIIFDYPSASIWRYPLDILILFLLLSHLRRGDVRFLAAAGILCGFSCFYMMDTGAYITVAYAFYVLSNLAMDIQDGPLAATRIKVLKAAGSLLIVPVTFLGCLSLSQGHYIFEKVFWQSFSARTSFFLAGHGDLPIYKSLLDGKYLESWMGFFIPWVYTFILVVMSTLFFLKKVSREYLFMMTVTVYGLGLYHYYIVRSADTSYYVVALPFVFILGFALNAAVDFVHPYRKPLLEGVLALALFALFTNHYFLSYPNLLQLSRNPITRPFVVMKLEDGLSFFNHNDMVWPETFKLSTNSLGETDEGLKTEKDFNDDNQLKEYVRQEFDFSQDAGLIARLTAKDEKVPLISSFETKILMQADRRPFFYYFPMVDTRPMRMRMFDMTSLWTTGHLSKILKQLQEETPPYIFMEKILMAPSVPSSYQYLYPEVLVMLNYIHQHYAPYEEGHYLIAMKRKDF